MLIGWSLDGSVWNLDVNGHRHLLPDEATAAALYGDGWERTIQYVPDAVAAFLPLGDAVASVTLTIPAPVVPPPSDDPGRHQLAHRLFVTLGRVRRLGGRGHMEWPKGSYLVLDGDWYRFVAQINAHDGGDYVPNGKLREQTQAFDGFIAVMTRSRPPRDYRHGEAPPVALPATPARGDMPGVGSPFALENRQGVWHPVVPTAVMTRPPFTWESPGHLDEVFGRYRDEGWNFVHTEIGRANMQRGDVYQELHRMMEAANHHRLGVWWWLAGDEEGGRADRRDFPPHSRAMIERFANEMRAFTAQIIAVGYDLDEWLGMVGWHATARVLHEVAPTAIINARPGSGVNNPDGYSPDVIRQWATPPITAIDRVLFDQEAHRPSRQQVQQHAALAGRQLPAMSDRYRDSGNQHPEKDMRSDEEMASTIVDHMEANVAAIYGKLRGHRWSASMPPVVRHALRYGQRPS